jgi:hypothetical protein
MSVAVETDYPTAELVTPLTPMTAILQIVDDSRPPSPPRPARRRTRLSRRGRVVVSLLGLIAVVGGATGLLRLEQSSTPSNAPTSAHQVTASETPPPKILFPLQRPAG